MTFARSFLAFSFIFRDSETWASGKWFVYFVILLVYAHYFLVYKYM